MPGLTQEQDLMVSTIVEQMDARALRQSDDWKAAQVIAKRGGIVKEYVALGGSLVAVIGVATAYIFEMDAKPTTEKVQEAIVENVAPVAAETKALKAGAEEMRGDISEIQHDIERIEKVQDLSMDNDVWQGDVLNHMATKKRGPVPQKPQRLRDKERELIRR